MTLVTDHQFPRHSHDAKSPLPLRGADKLTNRLDSKSLSVALGENGAGCR